MKAFINKHKNFIMTVLALTMVCFLFLAECFSTIGYQCDAYWILHLLTLSDAGALYCLFAISLFRISDFERRKKNLCQFEHIDIFFIAASLLFLFMNIVTAVIGADSSIKNIFSTDNGNIYKILSQLLAVIITITALALVRRKEKKLCLKDTADKDADGNRVNGRVKDNLLSWLPIIIICVAEVVVSILTTPIQFKWDGALYYEALNQASVYSLSSMALYGHKAQTVALIIRWLVPICLGHVDVAVFAGNILMYVVGTLAFSGTIRELTCKRYENVCSSGYRFFETLSVLIFACSPYVLGMVGYYGLDYYCMTLFLCVVYFTLREEWLLQIPMGLLLCFSKEPGLIIYGVICIGCILLQVNRLKKQGNYKAGRILKEILSTPHYYGMAMCAVLWLAMTLLLGVWRGGEGGFAFDPEFILNKLKNLYILNFSWVFVILIICSLLFITICRNRIRNNSEKDLADSRSVEAHDDTELVLIFYIWLPMLAYTVFSCLFRTVNHARYAEIIPPCLYILTVFYLWEDVSILHLIAQKKIPVISVSAIIMFILCGLMAISSFRTVDPISLALYRTVDVGNSKMLMTQMNRMAEIRTGDSMIYNSQALGFESALEPALSDGIEAGDTILFPLIDGTIYFFDGASGVEMSGDSLCTVTHEFWNSSKQKRSVICKDGYEPLDIMNVADGEAVDQIVSETSFSYYYLSFEGEDIAEYIRDNYHVIEENVYTSRGWKVYQIRFSKIDE